MFRRIPQILYVLTLVVIVIVMALVPTSVQAQQVCVGGSIVFPLYQGSGTESVYTNINSPNLWICSISCPVKGAWIICWLGTHCNCSCNAEGVGVCTCEQDSAVNLVSFSAETTSDSVLLTWQTGTEIDHAGFNIYRATQQDRVYTQINDSLIPAQGDASTGASYSFTDSPEAKGEYLYRLESIDTQGVSEVFEEITVSFDEKLGNSEVRTFLPLITR